MTERVFGHILDNPAGTTYLNRQAAAQAGVHRQLQGGICGGADGAESIVVSGGYIDDQDYGNVIVYTGQGGRDPDSGRQIVRDGSPPAHELGLFPDDTVEHVRVLQVVGVPGEADATRIEVFARVSRAG